MSKLIICTVMSGGKTSDLGDKVLGDKTVGDKMVGVKR